MSFVLDDQVTQNTLSSELSDPLHKWFPTKLEWDLFYYYFSF